VKLPRLEAPIVVKEAGRALLANPLLNKGTAFSEDERTAFSLHGRLPCVVGTLDGQIERRLRALRRLSTDLDKYIFLRALQDDNETLFYALLTQYLEEVLPIVYTPTVGEGCQTFSHFWSRPRGLFISWPQRERIDEIFADPAYDGVEAIVVSDGERILGLGDQGAGGMGISIGKLAIYSGCAGIHPSKTLPILLDVGTDNEELLADPRYIGWRRPRLRGAEYDELVERFVQAVKQRWPTVLLQWEDFALDNAGRLLNKYRNQLCTFNDDIQGTAAATAGALLAAMAVTGQPLTEQRIVVFGAGSAGCGVASLIQRLMVEEGASPAEARNRFYALNRRGLITDDMPNLSAAQASFAQPRSAVADWRLERADAIGLYDVIANVRPTVLIGASGRPAVFTEAMVRAMAEAVERPIIFPLSNPTHCAEAAPSDLLEWSGGRAIVGTGSPFAPVMRDGGPVPIDQVNNAYVFPGIGLGALSVGARVITDGMLASAARTLAGLSPAARGVGARLFPPVNQLREVAAAVARSVALQARKEGVCEDFADADLSAMIEARMWSPVYHPYERAVETGA
jgi:malate dehydrogenase (oxaloacetate-decarboxylating)